MGKDKSNSYFIVKTRKSMIRFDRNLKLIVLRIRQEKFEDTKEVTRSNNQKDRQYNGEIKKTKNAMAKRKRTTNNIQNTTQKTKQYDHDHDGTVC